MDENMNQMMTINWQRCVYINRAIDEELVSEVTRTILQLRQESNQAITFALDSPGGSVYLLKTLRGLVQSPDQDGHSCELVTVVTHKAYSAAAMLLASGDYAIALQHCELLFHDVRYGAVHDVTPSSALQAARQLKQSNDRESLELANHMFGRWMWMYLDIQEAIDSLRNAQSELATRFEDRVQRLNIPACKHVRIDIPGMLLFIHSNLRLANECVVDNALEKLGRWGSVSFIAGSSADGKPSALDGLGSLFKAIHGDADHLGGKENEEPLTRFLTVLAASLRGRSALEAVERAASELALFDAIDNPRHWQMAMKLMLRHKHVFFDLEIGNNWETLSDKEREEIATESSPVVRTVWLLCVMVARELFEGEHTLTPREALVLGLVDEVPGSTLFESRRQFSIKRSRATEAQSEPADLGGTPAAA